MKYKNFYLNYLKKKAEFLDKSGDVEDFFNSVEIEADYYECPKCRVLSVEIS